MRRQRRGAILDDLAWIADAQSTARSFGEPRLEIAWIIQLVLWRTRAASEYAQARIQASPKQSRPLDRFNLNLFFALDAILHAETLTEAGRSVHLSQPGMSKSLKKLRAYFNDDLVVYQGGETRLTALGIALKPRIRAALQTSREALNLSLAFDPAVDRHQIRITAPDVIELTFLSSLIADIASRAPAVETVSIPFTYQPVDALFRDNIDIAIVSEPFALPDYPRQPLFSDTISCLVWAGSTAFGETIGEADYFSARHAAMFHTPERLSHPIGAALHHLNLARDVVVRASVYSALPRMIIGTDLVVTTMTRFAHLCAETMPLRVVPVPVELPTINFVAQWQPYRSKEPIIEWLLERLREAAAAV